MLLYPLTWTELGRRREPHADPDDDEQRAQDLLEHVAERDSGSGAFGLRERLTGEQERVAHRRDEHQQHLGLPAGVRREGGRGVPGLREQEAQDAADDNAAGEPGVKRDEPARLVAGIHRGDERIHGRFDETVGDADDERGRKEDGEIRRHDRGQGPTDVADGGEPEQRAHAEEIAERSAQQDGEAEAPERGAGDPADVGFAQREQLFEVAHDVAANRERHGRRDERHAARAEQPLRRGRVDRVGRQASACAGFHGGILHAVMTVQPSRACKDPEDRVVVASFDTPLSSTTATFSKRPVPRHVRLGARREINMDLRRHATWACAIVMAATVMPTHGQSRPKATAGSPAAWKPSRTPDGQPDFQGTWANNTVTPFLRPAALADKPLLTDAELDVLKERAARLFAGDGDLAPGDELFDALLANPKTFVSPRPVGDYNQSWMMEPLAFEYRTSQVVDPPNGRLPALTPEGQRKQAAVDARRRDHPADGPEDRVPQERCITLGALKVGFVQTRVNSYYEIVQTPRYVLIHNEMMHEARIIPIDGRPHAPSSVRSWMGDSVGHWDGDTFVIETTNFHHSSVFRPTAALAFSAEHFHVVERSPPARRAHDGVSGDGHRSHDLDDAVHGAHDVAAVRRADLRVRVPRSELRDGLNAIFPPRRPPPNGRQMLDPDSSPAGSFAGMRLRYILDTEDWTADVVSWTVDAGSQQRTRIALEFGTGYAAMRAGRKADAAGALERLRRAREALGVAVGAANTASDAEAAREWARILEIQLTAVTSGIAGSIATLRDGAIAEEKLPIEFGPPAIDKPSYELLGEALLAANRPQEAQAAFEKALTRTPERQRASSASCRRPRNWAT